MTAFGSDDPREMPPHFFYRARRVDYASAVRADADRQNCSICPRYWYVDTVFPCERCGVEFTFTAEEQRVWYEEYEFWIDSLPKHCLSCRRALRELKAARQEYDQRIEEALRTRELELKKRLAGVIDQLYELGGELPPRINANRKRLALEIERAEQGAA
jgi:hypothetical protein